MGPRRRSEHRIQGRSPPAWNVAMENAAAGVAERTLFSKIGTSLAREGYRQSFHFAEGAYKWLIHPKWLAQTSIEILPK
jgi:hypothetical protein